MSHSAVHPMDEERASEMLPYAKKQRTSPGPVARVKRLRYTPESETVSGKGSDLLNESY